MKNWLTPNIRILSWISLFTDIASEMLYPVMPVFLISIGYSAAGIGLLEGFAEATAGLSKGFFGSLSDHTGKRGPFIRIGYALSAISKPLMGFIRHPFGVFFLRSTDRLGKGIRTGARDALLADESSTENRAKVFGYHRSMDTTGAVIGPLIAVAFLYFFPGNYSSLFLFAFIPGIAAIFLGLFLKSKSKGSAPIKEFKPFAFFGYYLKSNENYKKTLRFLLLFALINSSDMFLLLQLKSRGAGDILTILVYVFYNIVYAVFAYPLGKRAGKTGMKKTLIQGMILFSVAYAGIALSPNLYLLLVFFGIYGLYSAATEGVSKALLSTLCPDSEKATAIGFYNGIQSIASLIAGLITGLLWWQIGPAFALVFSSVCAIIVGLMFSRITLSVDDPYKR